MDPNWKNIDENEGGADFLLRHQDGLVLSTLNPLTFLAENLLTAKVIYVVRNPKDAMIRKLSNSIKNISQKHLCILRERYRVTFLIEKSEYWDWVEKSVYYTDYLIRSFQGLLRDFRTLGIPKITRQLTTRAGRTLDWPATKGISSGRVKSVVGRKN